METAPVPPQNLDAEESVLGASMLSDKAADRVLAQLEAHHFYRESHGLIHQAIRRLRDRDVEADPISVVAQLDEDGTLGNAGGRARILELAHLTPAVSNAAHHAQLVRDCWQKRQIIKRLGLVQEQAWNGGAASETLARVETALTELRESCDTRTTLVPAAEAAKEACRRILDPPTDEPGIPAPFPFLRALQPGRLYVLGGYQADGKTVTATMFLQKACEAGLNVGYASLEMSAGDLTDRLVSCTAAVPYTHVQNPRQLTPTERTRALSALETIGKWRFTIIDDPHLTVPTLTAHQRHHSYDLLIVDHLHQIDWEDRRDLERTITRITALARVHHVPILLLAQLHRNPQDRFPRPTMSSIRETGMIEALASAVWFVWRHRDDNQLPTNTAEFVIAKNRYGPIGKHNLEFVPERVVFQPIAWEDEIV